MHGHADTLLRPGFQVSQGALSFYGFKYVYGTRSCIRVSNNSRRVRSLRGSLPTGHAFHFGLVHSWDGAHFGYGFFHIIGSLRSFGL